MTRPPAAAVFFDVNFTLIYAEWAACQPFHLYDDVTTALRDLSARGLKIGLISNSHRCLVSFQQHFELDGLIAAAVSSSEHGYLKPHPSIFESVLTQVGVTGRRQRSARYRGREGRGHAWRSGAALTTRARAGTARRSRD